MSIFNKTLQLPPVENRSRTLSISLQPEDHKKVENLTVGSSVKVAGLGTVTSISSSEHGSSVTIELELVELRRPGIGTTSELVSDFQTTTILQR